MKWLIGIYLIMFAIMTYAHDCLPRHLKKLKKDSNYIIKTVSGDTYEEALYKLNSMMPHAGFLQKIEAKSKERLTNYGHYKDQQIKSSLKANVDMWMKYECKYHGEYYITAVVAKEDIVYAPYEIMKYIKLKDLKKKCGNQKITLLLWNIDLNYQYKCSGKAYSRRIFKYYGPEVKGTYKGYELLCGEMTMEIEYEQWGSYHRRAKYDNKFENFKVIGLQRSLGRYHRIFDLTLPVWLELTKGY